MGQIAVRIYKLYHTNKTEIKFLWKIHKNFVANWFDLSVEIFLNMCYNILGCGNHVVFTVSMRFLPIIP